ncbi:hypothetical protein DI09_19p90 [Mitosporidium daphniae]|uniref:Uncharacterized protein n=1 Tax=Mitosporidium daphniae TaxID=1485682 RepID=A0A098VTB0_9MICR|nr:uncharacterized protein DI09_19p90 [Mitosporidium daphniae]KGG52227.1 hypothetical protein DI09_19p90 [Mitosporidium daphniae]|eukprot:XP_013238692.1 uncharacterized protein DI09_19p90 [Mitosporidium daphniae]
MGISGLLPLLKPITKKTHLRDFSGKTVAIDGYSWIHKGVYGSGLAIFEGKDVSSHVTYCIKRLSMFLDAGVTPIFVFDGGPLPMKAGQEAERKSEEARKVVTRALKSKDRRMAWEYANRCIDVTPEMVAQLTVELQARKIAYIVAPYEADAQMAFLVKNGFADAVVSEDSDMLLFGCPQLGADGTGDLIQLEDIAKVASFKGFSHLQFRQTCILSGCDYLASLPKVGMGTAIRLMQTNRSIDAIFKALRSPTSNYDEQAIEAYIKGFILADLTFSHQRVWDPCKQSIVTLEPIGAALSASSWIPQDLANILCTNDAEFVPSSFEEWPFPVRRLEFLGPPITDPKIASGIALGAICPITKKTLNILPAPTEAHVFGVQVLKEPLEKKKPTKLPWLTRLSLKPAISIMKNEAIDKRNLDTGNSDKENMLLQPEFVEAQSPVSKHHNFNAADKAVPTAPEGEVKRRRISPYFENRRKASLSIEPQLSD